MLPQNTTSRIEEEAKAMFPVMGKDDTYYKTIEADNYMSYEDYVADTLRARVDYKLGAQRESERYKVLVGALDWIIKITPCKHTEHISNCPCCTAKNALKKYNK